MNFQLIIFLMICGLLLPSLICAQEQPISLPETSGEAQEIGERALEAIKELPKIIKKIWEEEALPIWQTMWDWFKTNIWSGIKNWIKPEIEKRKEHLKEEFERGKEEIKTEAPKIGQSLWEKLKELWK